LVRKKNPSASSKEIENQKKILSKSDDILDKAEKRKDLDDKSKELKKRVDNDNISNSLTKDEKKNINSEIEKLEKFLKKRWYFW